MIENRQRQMWLRLTHNQTVRRVLENALSRYSEGSAVRLSASEQAGKRRCGNDGNTAIVRGVKILVARDEVLGRRVCGHHIEEETISLVAKGRVGGNGDDEVGGSVDGSKKVVRAHAGSGKGGLQLGTADHCTQLCEGHRAHDRYDPAV